jgi:hypothetical protein
MFDNDSVLTEFFYQFFNKNYLPNPSRSLTQVPIRLPGTAGFAVGFVVATGVGLRLLFFALLLSLFI